MLNSACLGEGFESKATILAVLNGISSFLSECRVISKKVYISDIHFVVASRSELKDDISTISARLGEMDTSSSGMMFQSFFYLSFVLLGVKFY